MRFIKFFVIALMLVSAQYSHGGSQPQGQKSPIDITLTIENEGPGGLFAQLGKDLTDQELAQLRSGIEEKILGSKTFQHRIVPQDYAKPHLFLSMVVTKFNAFGGQSRFVAASSALSIGRVSGTIESLTHDVIVEPNIEQMVGGVQYYLATAEINAVLKLNK